MADVRISHSGHFEGNKRWWNINRWPTAVVFWSWRAETSSLAKVQHVSESAWAVFILLFCLLPAVLDPNSKLHHTHFLVARRLDLNLNMRRKTSGCFSIIHIYYFSHVSIWEPWCTHCIHPSSRICEGSWLFPKVKPTHIDSTEMIEYRRSRRVNPEDVIGQQGYFAPSGETQLLVLWTFFFTGYLGRR